jgi:hypothetical protein
MVFLLLVDVFQHSVKLTWAHGKRAITALPEKAAIASIKRFNPFRGSFLYLLNEISLGKGSRQRCHNMNMICNAADGYEFRTEVTANCDEVSMHAWPHV